MPETPSLPNTTPWFTEVEEREKTAFSFAVKQKLHTEKTPYQTIDIYETETFGNLMAIDGFVMLTTRDNFLYHEMMAHPVLFTHPNPKHIAIIGGGDCGTLKEVLKHDCVEHVTQIEIDERVTRLSEQYFPELCTSNNDPRAQLKFEDGIAWVKQAPENSLDVIIVDSADPVGPGEVLFTQPFYDYCQRALKPDGLFIMQSESPLFQMDLIQNMHQHLKTSGFSERHTFSFPQPCYPSGWWTATLGSMETSRLNCKTPEHMPFETHYYNRSVHLGTHATPPLLKLDD